MREGPVAFLADRPGNRAGSVQPAWGRGARPPFSREGSMMPVHGGGSAGRRRGMEMARMGCHTGGMGIRGGSVGCGW